MWTHQIFSEVWRDKTWITKQAENLTSREGLTIAKGDEKSELCRSWFSNDKLKLIS